MDEALTQIELVGCDEKDEDEDGEPGEHGNQPRLQAPVHGPHGGGGPHAGRQHRGGASAQLASHPVAYPVGRQFSSGKLKRLFTFRYAHAHHVIFANNFSILK